jgi:phospholipid transport system transporter-binding protein
VDKSSKSGAVERAAAAIELPADCRMAELPALRERCLAMPSGTLDAAAVTRVDTAALQLLVAVQSDARARGEPIAWANVSAPLREAAERLGLTQALVLPAAMPA